ncbi:MAG: bifunctional pyr operon transcriptional regulator/uracil phosphoribosyltransferase PyrR [Clostridia bacterium]|nr:bifunctional pyr operon transcriptional regulator/uracil phosphoribosyltransferase PyrR [Clostridia bacterium]
MVFKARLMDEAAMERALARIAHQIIENNADVSKLCLVGIQRRGVPLAEKIADNVRKFSELQVDVGKLDITLYRDDLTELSEPTVHGTHMDFDITGQTVVLVDDVIFTGRTVRAALDALMKQGRPAKVQLAVLVDRGHRELPIRGDYIGKNIPTSHREIIKVKMPPVDDCMDTCLYGL